MEATANEAAAAASNPSRESDWWLVNLGFAVSE
jgi:hypothetical protein